MQYNIIIIVPEMQDCIPRPGVYNSSHLIMGHRPVLGRVIRGEGVPGNDQQN